MKTSNEIYLEKRLKSIFEISPSDGIQKFFTGMYNYVSVDPKSNIHANDYYLYVKVFNSYFKGNDSIEKLFSDAIEQFLQKNDIYNAYIAYEVLVSQILLSKNNISNFEIDNEKMLDWLKKLSLVFKKNQNNLSQIKFGMGKLYTNGLEGQIRENENLIEKDYGIKIL